MTAEQRAAIEKVQSLFTPSEATVYQQRQNVLISAQGFRFPSGSSEIGPENLLQSQAGWDMIQKRGGWIRVLPWPMRLSRGRTPLSSSWGWT